jgi:hypothetical protein
MLLLGLDQFHREQRKKELRAIQSNSGTRLD